jgi:hypothetical protein
LIVALKGMSADFDFAKTRKVLIVNAMRTYWLRLTFYPREGSSSAVRALVGEI